MKDATVEGRLSRFGAQLDAAADRHKSSRSLEFPAMVELDAQRTAGPRTWIPVVAALVVVALALLAFVVVRDAATPTAASAPQWQRLDSRSAGFPRSIGAGVAGTVGERFIALGVGDAWSSTTGEQWTPLSLSNSQGMNLNGVAHANGVALVWAFTLNPEGPAQLWASRHGTRWSHIVPTGLDNVANLGLSIAGHGTRFVATGNIVNPDGSQSAAAWTSSDATHWQASTFDNGAPRYFGPPIWFRGRFISLAGQSGRSDELKSVWSSADGTTWTKIADSTPARLGSLYVPPNGARIYGIQYETAGVSLEQGGTFGGRLMASPDGVTWSEITTFHDELPVANPDHILRTHGWWILSGNTGTPNGQRRADIWMSRDLKHWTELPERLQGKTGNGIAVPTATNGNVVIATALLDHTIWIWHP